MNIRFKGLLTAVIAAAMLLTGCGDSSSGLSESQLYEMEFDTNKYDSHITYTVEGTSNENELTEVAKQLEQRIERCFGDSNSDHPSAAHQTQTNHGDKTVTIYFNNTANLSSQFMEFTATENKVELRKGDKPDGELVITADEIYDAQSTQMQDSETGKGDWGVLMKLTNEGREKFSKATTELAKTQEVITIWLDGKALSSPKVVERITNGSCRITGGDINDEQAAWELAYRLRSGHIKNKVTVKECSLKEKTDKA